MLDLVALALGATGDVAHDATARGLRAARSLAVRQSVSAQLRNPGLSAADIAKANAISERYLRQLFADIGTSFSDFLIERRLELAHRLLVKSAPPQPSHFRNRLRGGVLGPIAFQPPLSRPLRRHALGGARRGEAGMSDRSLGETRLCRYGVVFPVEFSIMRTLLLAAALAASAATGAAADELRPSQFACDAKKIGARDLADCLRTAADRAEQRPRGEHRGGD